MAHKILFADKVGVTPQETHINQIWDEDMNEIKQVVNDNADDFDLLEQEVDVNTLDIIELQAAVTEQSLHFTAESKDTFAVPNDTSPAFMTGMVQLNGINGFVIDGAKGAIKNISGKTLIMRGQLGIQYQRSGVGDVDFWIYSESSTDGVVWTKNEDSLRQFLIDRDGVDYKTIVAFTEDGWADGTYIRFMFAKDGNGLDLVTLSKTFGGDTIDSHSFILTMQAQ